MPIETQDPSPDHDADVSIASAFIGEARQTLTSAMKKIEHCLKQLRDEDVWWRQHESHNSIQNILLHLCGNVRQWIVHGVAQEPDVRERTKEFADRRPLAKAELLARLRETLAEADQALAEFSSDRLLQPCRIQGFDTTVLAAIFDSVSHFVGHTHQIVYITRLRLGDAYRFQWEPTNAEQGAWEQQAAIAPTAPTCEAPAEPVNLQEKFARFSGYWSPKIVGELNGQHVKLLKFQGEFVWHKHDNEDELFLIVKGRFRMEFRDRHVWLSEGELLIVPRGLEHRPVAEEEVHVLLFEPASTLNTGNVQSERTVADLERI